MTTTDTSTYEHLNRIAARNAEGIQIRTGRTPTFAVSVDDSCVLFEVHERDGETIVAWLASTEARQLAAALLLADGRLAEEQEAAEEYMAGIPTNPKEDA